MSTVNPLVRKIARVLVGLTYYNLILLLIAYNVYLNVLFLTIILLDQLVYIGDTMIRPATPREQADITTKLVGLFFILHPFILALFFYENLLLTAVYLVILDNNLMSYIGIGIYVIGAIITLTSRVQLGRYGSGVISIEDEHHLITSGIYGYIRNPLYLGALIGRIGLVMSFRGYVSGFLVFLSYFLVFRKRIQIEEQMLISEFGDEYLSYMKNTKRLIPKIW